MCIANTFMEDMNILNEINSLMSNLVLLIYNLHFHAFVFKVRMSSWL